MRVIAWTLFILDLLWDRVRAENSISSLREAAVAWEGELPCRQWDCDCAFKHQRGCCCAAAELQEVEDQIFTRMMDLLASMSQLGGSIVEVIGRSMLKCKLDVDKTNSPLGILLSTLPVTQTQLLVLNRACYSHAGGMRIGFTASVSSRTNCIGPFTRNSPIPYDVITLNHGHGYNPALGIFTAPRSGVYSFSFSIYSKVGGEGERMYYKVQLMRNREVVASMWEDNREDSEDSSSQTVLLSLQQGGQVYVELLSGRQLCGIIEGLNTFSGSLIYSTQA